jgi:hypothetical protein
MNAHSDSNYALRVSQTVPHAGKGILVPLLCQCPTLTEHRIEAFSSPKTQQISGDLSLGGYEKN